MSDDVEIPEGWKTEIKNTEHVYEDDGLLVLVVKEQAPSGIVDPHVVEQVIRDTVDAGWNLYFRADKHSVVYLIFMF